MRTVLHVLPHPGGGGEAYVDLLARMDGYRFERVYLAATARPVDAIRSLPRAGARLVRRADLVHVHGEVAGAICLPVLAVRRSLLTLHGLHLFRRSSGAKRRLALANLRLVLAAATRTICVSQAERDELVTLLGSEVDVGLEVILNGVDPEGPVTAEERAVARVALALPDGVVAGAWVGRLDAVKDPLTAARAAIQLAEAGLPFALLLAGDGPLEGELEQLASAAPAGAVRVLGYRDDVRVLLAAADIFVLSSQREGLPFSLLEAMSMGLPSVISDVAGTVEAMGDAGLAVPCSDVDALASALTDLVSDEAKRLALGSLARARVDERFRADDMVEHTRRLYDQVAAGRA